MGKTNPDINIVFMDKHERLGGAWYSDTSPEGSEIECGCHIWTYCPEVYDYLSNELKLDLEVMRPNPVFRYKGIRFSYPLYTIFNSYRLFFKYLLTFNGKELKNLKNNPEIYFKIFGKRNQYPKLGSPVLMNRLKELMDELPNFSFSFGQEIEEVKCGDQIELKTNKGDVVCDELYTTSVSSIKRISNSERSIDLTHRRRDYIHILVKSDKKPLKKVTYDRLVNDSHMHRVCDISYQTNHKENLYLAGILEEPFYSTDNEILKDHLQAFLKKTKAISKDTNLELVKEHIFPTYYINQAEREQLESFDDRIKLFYSVDLMYGFYYILKEHGLIN